MRYADDAADYSIERANSGEEMAASGYCLQFTRENYPIGSYYYSAIDAWNAAEHQHPGGSPSDAPRGFPCFFYSSSPYDHVAISIGGGQFVSVWNEEIRICSEATMLNTFGPWIGYSEDLNRVRIYSESTGGDAAEEDDDMRIIQRGTTSGTILLIGPGWVRALNGTEKAAFVAAGYPFKVIAAEQYDAVNRALSGGTYSTSLTSLVTAAVAPVKDRTDRYLNASSGDILGAAKAGAWSFVNSDLETSDAYGILRHVRDGVDELLTPETE